MGLTVLVILCGAGGGGYYVWKHAYPPLPLGISFGNGRIEADEVDIDTKGAGRVAELLVDIGDMVSPSQVLARMDTRDIEQSLSKSEAQIRQAQHSIDEARANLAQQQSGRRLDPTVYVWRGPLSVLRNRDRPVSGHDRTIHAPARTTLYAGRRSHEHFVRQRHAAGKHAPLACGGHAGISFDAFCVVRSGDPVPWRRPRCGVAAIYGGRRHCRVVSAPFAYSLPIHAQFGRSLTWVNSR
ncbi:MAG TPA: hypothetical protein VKB76_13375 [Ktedonobacterales bacterium]|nr:hypothetical protein [Ktedonobacterales bacterium]